MTRKRKTADVVFQGLEAGLRMFRWVVVILLVLFLFSGITKIEPDSVGLLLRFGKLQGASPGEQVRQPGLLLALPFPIDEVKTVPGKDKEKEVVIDEVWKELGETATTDTIDPVLEGYCLTGDYSIFQAKLAVKYKVTDPVAFELWMDEKDREALLRDVVLAALVQTLATWTMDDAMRLQRVVSKADGSTQLPGEGKTDLEGSGTADPEANGGADLEGNAHSDHGGNGGTGPEGNGSAGPEGNGGTGPEGNGSAGPEGNGGTGPERNGNTGPEGDASAVVAASDSTALPEEGSSFLEGEGSPDLEGTETGTEQRLAQVVWRRAQQRLDALAARGASKGCGMTISALEFQEGHPPRHVIAEFQQVQSAKIGKDILRQQALGFKNREIPDAQAKKNTMIQEANAYKDTLVARANADVSEFQQLYEQYQQSPGLVWQRIYQETIETVLTNVKKHLFVSPGTRVILGENGESQP
jgi:regulator of protease activity HflC (stomatin/prohibitin superfamily)